MFLPGFVGQAVWFVHGSRIVSLTGSARLFTPRVPFPQEIASVDLWRNTGLSAPNAPTGDPNVMVVGLRVAFGS